MTTEKYQITGRQFLKVLSSVQKGLERLQELNLCFPTVTAMNIIFWFDSLSRCDIRH